MPTACCTTSPTRSRPSASTSGGLVLRGERRMETTPCGNRLWPRSARGSFQRELISKFSLGVTALSEATNARSCQRRNAVILRAPGSASGKMVRSTGSYWSTSEDCSNSSSSLSLNMKASASRQLSSHRNSEPTDGRLPSRASSGSSSRMRTHHMYSGSAAVVRSTTIVLAMSCRLGFREQRARVPGGVLARLAHVRPLLGQARGRRC